MADIPQSGDENVRLNLWLVNGTPPSDNNEAEVVIKSFDFVPLSAPPPAVIVSPKVQAGGVFQANLSVQPDFRYDIQASSNLMHWDDLTNVLAITDKLIFLETNSSPVTARLFLRNSRCLDFCGARPTEFGGRGARVVVDVPQLWGG